MNDYQIIEICEDLETKQNFIEYAKKVNWSAGPFLAKLIEYKESTGYDKIFAIMFMNKYFCGFCRFSAKDCIETTLEPWIGFLFVEEKHRGKKLSKLLIDHCIQHAKALKFKHIYLASQEYGFYEKYGFELIDYAIEKYGFELIDAIDKYGEKEQIFSKKIYE